jgi:hypothetical protein
MMCSPTTYRFSVRCCTSVFLSGSLRCCRRGTFRRVASAIRWSGLPEATSNQYELSRAESSEQRAKSIVQRAESRKLSAES